jgi:hypothetical protein
MWVETPVNIAERFVPTAVTAIMIATAIKDTNRPYSTALAPDSSLKKFLIRSMLFSPFFGIGFLWFRVAPVNKLLKFRHWYLC